MAKRGRPAAPHPEGKVTRLAQIVAADGRPQYIIAACCGISAPLLSEMIHGKRTIPVHSIYRFCVELKVNPEDLMGWAEELPEELRPSDSRPATRHHALG